MSDFIFLVDPETKKPTKVKAVRFSDISIRERQDLEEWIINNPDLLGEDLLVITSEFAGFKHSERRIDVIALDKNGKLVVIELKLDAFGSHADLQAVRYAAFCSTMDMDGVIDALVQFEGITKEEAENKILNFLGANELPDLDDSPRIILAAGSIDDQEITSTALWLRIHQIDISCVEITPYQIPEAKRIMLVPRVVIPPPEAKEYMIRVEKKEAKLISNKRDRSEYTHLWNSVAEEFSKYDTLFKIGNIPAKSSYFQIRVGKSNVHYEWAWRKSRKSVDVCLHFEYGEREKNIKFIELIGSNAATIKENIPYEFTAEPWGKYWAEAKFAIPYSPAEGPIKISGEAARIMNELINLTWPIIENVVD